MPSQMASSLIAAVNTSPLARKSASASATKKMSITQTYYLAHSARSKLAKEAARADHDLRVLVGHANMLDSLMLDLANAEREQEQWFNNTVRNATKKSAAQPSHIRWADTIEEESMEDDSDSDSDLSDDDDYSDYDEEEEEEKMKALTTLYTASAKPLRRAPSPPALVTIDDMSSDSDSDEDEDEDEEAEAARLTLTRSPSRQQSPPELLDDLSSDEDEEISMPPSPEDVPLDTFSSTSKTTKQTSNLLTDTTSQSLFEEHDFIHHQGTMIPAY